MTLSVSSQVSPITSRLIVETAAGSAANINVLGVSASIYMVEVDNTANSAASYLKIYNNAAPSVGSTAPDVILMASASSVLRVVYPGGLVMPILSFACVTTPGNGGAASPNNPVIVRIACG